MKARVVLLVVEVEVFEEEEDELVREEGPEPFDFLSPTPSPAPRATATATRATAEMRRIRPLEDEDLAIVKGRLLGVRGDGRRLNEGREGRREGEAKREGRRDFLPPLDEELFRAQSRKASC